MIKTITKNKIFLLLINETSLIIATLFSIVIILFSDTFGVSVVWLSIAPFLVVCVYYSVTFFSSPDKGAKLYFFAATCGICIGYFAVVYHSFGIIDTSTGETIQPDWLNAIYFSVVTWTTLGYGDFKPTELVKAWVMIEALMGYIFMGLFVGKLIFLGQLKLEAQNNNWPKKTEG
jgi:hypothetical protein